ncbi:MAG: amidohydrolase family protein [Bacteroidetes bacterium]|nr:amidohydrolase family protein [Bacteroidota bacterium]
MKTTPLRASLLFAVLLCAGVSATFAQSIALKAGRLVDPATGTASSNQIILIEDGIIQAVGADVSIPAGATVIDLAGQTVMPGLFDAHTHLCLNVKHERDAGNFFFTTLLDPTGYRAIQGVANARAMLESGFTTIRDIGNAANYADTDLRRAIEEGLVPGPTMQNSGRIIAPYGGQFQLQQDKRGLGNPEYLYADTRDELKKAIRENIHFGATVIKIVVDDQPYIYSPEDIRFMVEEAEKAGVKVAAHCWTEQGARNAIAAGVASIEHGPDMPDDVLRLAKEKGIYLVGTELTEMPLYEPGDLTDQEVRDLHEQFIDRLRRAYRLDVPMAFGSDVVFVTDGYTRGTATLTYLENFRKAGVPAPYALKMMTTNAADLMGLSDERGAIRPGLAADLIAMPANPLDDLRALHDVSFVMKDGVVFRHATADER